MTFNQLAILLIASLIVAIFLFAIAFKGLPKRKFHFAFASGHLVFVSLIGFILLRQGDDAQASLLWLVAVFTDLPVSLALFPMRHVLPGLSPDSVLGSFIFFAVIGSGQYFLYGMLIDIVWCYWRSPRRTVPRLP